MRRKAVFFDIDGTLYDFRRGIYDSTKEALRRLGENGHYRFLCTGRTMASIYDRELLDLGFDGMVAGCGTYVTLKGELLLNEEIPLPKLRDTLDICRRCRMIPVLEGERYLYYYHSDYLAGKQDDYMKMLEEEIPGNLAAIEENAGCLRVNKFSVLCEEPALAEEGLRLLEKDYHVMHFTEERKEFIPKGHTKATGMRLLCDRLGMEAVDTYAFGDSGNDLDMLRFAGCGIAMGNASQDAKEAADYVTRDIKEHGIYFGLKEFGLI